jgi:hypothetical protein
MALSQSDRDTIAEIVAAALAAAAQPQPVAESAPAPVRAASPFTLVRGSGRSDARPDIIRSQPDQRTARQAAAYHAVAGYACDNLSRTMAGPDGPRNVGHGFAYARKSGDACPTQGCTGRII